MGSNANLEVQCTCKRWTFDHLRISTAVLLSQEHCPRCRVPQLIIMRRDRLLGVFRLIGKDVHSLYQTLSRNHTDLSVEELRDIVSIAMVIAKAANQEERPATKRTA